MGAVRKTHFSLPKRVYKHHNAYYYMPKPADGEKQKRIRLGDTLSAALEKLKEVRVAPAKKPIKKVSNPDTKTSNPALATRLYRSMISRARTSGLDVSATLDDVYEIVTRAAGRCEVSGVKFSNSKVATSRKRPWAPSIDRIDASKGYHLENMRLVCVAANIALADFGDEVLRKLADGVVRIFHSA